MKRTKPGLVYLVGAGPGDPGLLTLKGRDCLRQADVIVYDNLANRALLNHASDDAEMIYVGKKGDCHTLSQTRINTLIIDKAFEGNKVVRLKGGDPFIFGRGGEEARELAEAGVPFEVIPGVTSAVAVPAYAGIPLTYRDFNATVAFITGHEDPDKKQSSIAWDRLATGAGVLVFLMGVGNLHQIADKLIDHGRKPSTPVAVISRGTSPGQRTLVGELHNIARMAEDKRLQPPAVIVVGEVVHLRKMLNWFESKPLFGRRIVVTRAREQASQLLQRLAAFGGECIEFPTIKVVPPDSWQPLDRAITRLPDYDWLLFTSANGVKYFLERLAAQGKDVRALGKSKVGAIGPKTARMLHRSGIRPDLVPDEYRAEAVAADLKDRRPQGLRILLPRAAQAREVLPDELRKMKAQVDVVPAYQTVNADHDSDRVKQLLEESAIDIVTFTSSSTVKNFAEMFSGEGRRLQKWMREVAVACIGPVTARTAEEQGFKVSITPPEYTIEALTDAIVRYFRGR